MPLFLYQLVSDVGTFSVKHPLKNVRVKDVKHSSASSHRWTALSDTSVPRSTTTAQLRSEHPSTHEGVEHRWRRNIGGAVLQILREVDSLDLDARGSTLTTSEDRSRLFVHCGHQGRYVRRPTTLTGRVYCSSMRARVEGMRYVVGWTTRSNTEGCTDLQSALWRPLYEEVVALNGHQSAKRIDKAWMWNFPKRLLYVAMQACLGKRTLLAGEMVGGRRHSAHTWLFCKVRAGKQTCDGWFSTSWEVPTRACTYFSACGKQ